MEIKVAGLESEFRTFSSTVTNNMDAMRQAQNVLLRANGIDPDTLLSIVPPPNRSTNPCATPPEPVAVPTHQDQNVYGESVRNYFQHDV